jgi:hypothetical protein
METFARIKILETFEILRIPYIIIIYLITATSVTIILYESRRKKPNKNRRK